MASASLLQRLYREHGVCPRRGIALSASPLPSPSPESEPASCFRCPRRTHRRPSL